MARIHYENESLNVNMVLQFSNNDLSEKFKDDPSWKKLQTLVDYSGIQMNTTVNEVVYEEHLFYWAMLIPVVFIIIGLVGLIVKLKKKDYNSVVKITKCSSSIWTVVVGTLLALSEGTYFVASKNMGKSALLYMTVASAGSSLIRVAIIDYKMFTTILYSFQNVMIFRPFFFRRHKVGFAKWLLRTTLGQWVVTTTLFLSGTMFLVNFKPNGGCEEVFKWEDIWRMTVIGSTYLSFVLSLILSCIYVVGYSTATISNVSQTRRVEMQQTLVSCSVEILFDASVLLYIGLIAQNCMMNDEAVRPYLRAKNCTEVASRLQSLEAGIGKCAAPVLASQPLCQEFALLVLELITWSLDKF